MREGGTSECDREVAPFDDLGIHAEGAADQKIDGFSPHQCLFLDDIGEILGGNHRSFQIEGDVAVVLPDF